MITFQKEQCENADLDYEMGWADWLTPVNDTIATSTWEASADITLTQESETDTTTTVWIEGGTIGQTYTIVNHIVTVAGREDCRAIALTIT